MKRFFDEDGKELPFRDCLGYAYCYKRYPGLENYLDQLEYTGNQRKKGIVAREIGKRIWATLSKVMSYEDITTVSLALDSLK